VWRCSSIGRTSAFRSDCCGFESCHLCQCTSFCPNGGMVDAWGLRSHGMRCAGSNPALGTNFLCFYGLVAWRPPVSRKTWVRFPVEAPFCILMIRIKINQEKSPESSFLFFKKLSSFALHKYRKGFYFEKKKRK
jgi:hypothetical protein